MFLKHLFILYISIEISGASVGDRSPYYQRCLEKCQLANCTEDGANFVGNFQQPTYLKLMAWSCEDECKYNCMWATVDSFHERKWKTPQFYGKWPFVRILGIQEPASVVFSLLNLYNHLKMIKIFHRRVRSDSPLYWLWFVYCMICSHAWAWSAIFHARDFPLTELLDYACAFSIVLINCYVMMFRVLRYIMPRFFFIVITVLFLALFANHTAYLSMGQFDYEYNMQINIIVGTITALCWFIWSVIYRYRQPYVWKCAMFVALTGLILLLELVDQPPIFYVFDYHSLWHLATAPLVLLIYSFAIDDCHFLRKTEIIDMQDERYKPKHR
ncbi:unnamed protein product [Ceutorhynchus assimilis]|uniref:Post-GPI attachment to proteins factor 3 n=1 Tax=Ceutorhynchus assimilis TaxID=467358 RepID=A0A9N9MA44_9CUCU|nr:unnamed protein product [Ceutorhynchus assimilis]